MKMKLLAVIGIFITSGAWAGEGHSHGGKTHSHGGKAHSHAPEISADKVKDRSRQEISRLIKKGKLEAGWSSAKFVSSEKKMFKGKEEWLVVYENEVSDKKKLYIFLSPSGKFIAANHTGK